MKKIALLLIMVSTLSCSIEEDGTNTTPQSAKWSLVRITGGVAGVDINLEREQITWIFDEFNNNIIVEENVPGVSHGLSEGTYSYYLQNISNADFIFVDEVEYGDIKIGQSTLTIDENINSTSTNTSDKFKYRFVR